MEVPNATDYIRRYMAGETAEKLGQELQVKGETFARWLRQRNIKTRTKAESRELTTLPHASLQEIIRRYVAGESVLAIAGMLGVSRSAIHRRLRQAGVIARNMHEAQLARWVGIDDVDRRKRQVAAANAAARGRKRSPCELMLQAASRQANLLNTFPTEDALASSLRSLGVDIGQQVAVGPYNLDLAFTGTRIAMEIEGGRAFQTRNVGRYLKRMKYIVDHAWKILIIYTRHVPLRFPAATHKALAFRDLAGGPKTADCQYGVIRGDGESYSIPSCQFHGFARVPGF